MNQNYEKRLLVLLQNDPWRLEVLKEVSNLMLPDCWVAAGFARNLVWDYLHHKQSRLNDVDVIYYCQVDSNQKLAKEAASKLNEVLPSVNWQVKNQAVMHRKNGHTQYASSEQAITYWPEKETAVGVRFEQGRGHEVIAPFGLTSLFTGYITYNPKSDKQVFSRRVAQKRWLELWPELRLKS